MVTEKEEKEQSKKREFLKWLIPIIPGGIALVIQVAVVPIFGLPESERVTSGEFWMLNEDLPPPYLVYNASDEGSPQIEYSPSSLYTLRIEQTLTFTNPVLWAPSKTYYPPYQDCELVKVMDADHIEYHGLNNTAVTLSSTARYLDKKTSSIKLVWKCPGCTADGVILKIQRYENILRGKLLNYYEYPIKYLGFVVLPTLRTNTLYMIEDSPSMLHPSESLEIWSENNTKIASNVSFPFIIELPEYTGVAFDIKVLDEPPKISLIWQGYIDLEHGQPGPNFVWVIIAVGTAVIIVVIILIFRRRRLRV